MEEKKGLYDALPRAQATYSVAHKTGYNPHYKSSFSTFEDLVLASRESLTREGIAVVQYVETKEGDKDYFVTVLMHKSEEIIKSQVLITVKDRSDVQKWGSVVSYLKRYMYASMCGIATSESDDDGEQVVQEPIITDKQANYLKALIKGDEELEDKICKHYGVNSIGSILAKHMNQIVDKLRKD